MRLRILCLVFLISLPFVSHARRFTVSTNLLGYAELGTLNAEASYAVSRRWSLTAGARYNPFIYNKGDALRQFQYKQQSYSIGVRMWPWHTWSGWWLSTKVRYQEYNTGGIFSQDTYEGDRVGMGLYAGYTLMVSRHFNVEFGLGAWGGVDMYTKYSCPVCGLTVGKGKKGFLLPDDVMISVVYVF